MYNPCIKNYLSVTPRKGHFFITVGAESGVRTHEAYAVELKSTPFDRSGISAISYLINPS